jgi:hypothetical protein
MIEISEDTFNNIKNPSYYFSSFDPHNKEIYVMKLINKVKGKIAFKIHCYNEGIRKKEFIKSFYKTTIKKLSKTHKIDEYYKGNLFNVYSKILIVNSDIYKNYSNELESIKDEIKRLKEEKKKIIKLKENYIDDKTKEIMSKYIKKNNIIKLN